ncbi:MAG: zinc-dependent metalloprotease [Fimbriimonadaceae bacterium]|nr:zinc-dependent metalloprotease [Fimbriimonadaceae bacterium]
MPASIALFVCALNLGVGLQDKTPSIAEKVAGLARRDGFLTTYLDRANARVYLRLPAPTGDRQLCAEAIYQEGLRSGLGSNDVGLDRGQMGQTLFVELRRLGDRVLVEAPNLRYRAQSPFPEERRAVRESFATSVLWAGKIAGLDADGSSLVDFTSFVVRDAHDVVASLRGSQQGTYRLDANRSVLDSGQCPAFPDNLEFEALLTFATDASPGAFVRATTPEPTSVTLTQHVSLVRPPAPGYRARTYDPRIGAFHVAFFDYAAPLDEPIEKRLVCRFRLEKTDPSAAISPVKRPIVYYVDRGVPEPVRTALVEGARWWAEAFEKAGFKDAFRVELLPDDADPMDVRYNVIQWVHRATRGWSFGNSVVDPRTGEILKGHVTLGSLRVRQDRLLFEGLLGTDKTGSGDLEDPVRLSLERMKQLAAHEVGHTLGFSHNFAASVNNRASVMDYPAPLVLAREDGTLDVARSYRTGIGEWDLHTVRWSYGEYPAGADEAKAQDDLVREGIKQGYLFLSDQDARSPGSAHPAAHLWDNGADPLAALEEAIKVRQIALLKFGERNIEPGQPLASLEEVLAPVYYWHRYQLEAAAKLVGGMEYAFALRGDGQVPTAPVPGARQTKALALVLRCLDPDFLDIPESVLRLLAPRPAGFARNREQFPNQTGATFDALAAAGAGADIVVGLLTNPERCARLVEFHRRDRAMPSLDQALGALVDRAFAGSGELGRTVQSVVATRLMDLGAGADASPAVRAGAEAALVRMQERLSSRGSTADPQELAHARRLGAEIKRWMERPFSATARSAPPVLPPGQPIGMAGGQDDCPRLGSGG